MSHLFSELDGANHPLVGKIYICNTYIMERLYLYLVQTHRGNTIHTETFKSMIEKMYKNPEKAIESRLYLNIESFALIDLDNDKSITDA